MRRSFVKKSIGVLLTVMMFTSVMVGCGPKGNEPSSSGTGTGTETDGTGAGEMIKLDFWRAGTDVEGENYWKECIGRFEADNPNIKIELSSLPWGNDIETKLNAAYASDTAPDVLNYAILSIPQRAGIGQYLALDDYIADWEGKDDIYESILNSGKFNDEVYGLGLKPDPRMFVWRKDMFEEAGLDPETPPKNWEELKEYAIKLTKKDGKTTTQSGFNFAIANGFQDFQIFLTQNGGDFIDASNHEVLFDSPEAIETLEYLTEFAKEGLTIPADTFQAGTDAFLNGVSAMTYKNPSDIRGMLEANPELKGKIGMSAPLSQKQSKTFSGLGLQFISESSKNKDAAWEFVKMTMSPEEIKIREDLLGIPVVRKSLEAEYIAKDPELHQAIMDSIAVGQGAYMVTYSNRLNEVISTAIEQAYYDKKTPEEALKGAAEEFRNEIPSLRDN